MRTVLAYAAMLGLTFVFGLLIILATLVGITPQPNGFLEGLPRVWTRVVLRAAGCRLRLHNYDVVDRASTHVYVSNHVSWFDVFALASVLPRFRFVAKKELKKLPIFGKAAGAVAAIYIDRQNRKAAFEGYTAAAQDIRGGVNVAVYPEGTRGHSYALRPFKKGPFVLAIAAQVPVIPVVVFGTRAVQPKGSFRVRAGDVDITFLEPIPTEGMTYDDRDRLMRMTWERMAGEMERAHGVISGAMETLQAES